MSQAPETGRPGRYERSFGGLVGSMIVLVLVVLGIVVFRGSFRDTPEFEPPEIDYPALVASVQHAGMRPVYAPELPDGWTVKDASYRAGERPALDVVFATDDGHTAGIHQEDASERDLLESYVGEQAAESGETLTTPVGTWTGWDDTDDDHAWTTEVDDQTVLVFSSGDADELRAFVESLTTEPIAS
ncbi:DUF4245 family protein [Nocardioides sp. MAH-18]|uniref:DUF4245 family protein n=1 Tax=Nocardioides agri TaxID=2682843 RepID=A0A6L6XQ60_9ACTN|nr:DUF4245 family protein [Nocardioides sp. CGMCC 1.13656]MBA2954079.1 DUF4245 family protein [Nocardioides sp. CGMCC 1.13656]MVQ48942.1 DUF4245 family protein [Nocardioides sp. MAH-18]